MSTTETVVIVNGHECPTGCWVDGHWGQYGASRVLTIADELLGTDYFGEAVSGGATFGIYTNELDGHDNVTELSDFAIDKLNLATQDGFAWGWYDGEFFLQSGHWWEEETY